MNDRAHEIMSDVSLESSRSSIGFSSARKSVGGSSSSNNPASKKQNNVKEYWNTKPLATYSAPAHFTFFKSPHPQPVRHKDGMVSPPLPSKKSVKMNVRHLKPLLRHGLTSSKDDSLKNKKFDMRDISESQQVRLLKNITDYVRFYAGSVNNVFRMDDVEYLVDHPVFIPIDLTQDENSTEGLLLTLRGQFQAGKLTPLKWFDIITDWKKGFDQVMTFDEFSVGLNRYCDEKELSPWEEEDLDMLFRYFVRSKEIMQLDAPYIRRHDFKIGLKKLHFSHRRKLWLNAQASILCKVRYFVHALKTSVRDFSLDYILIQRHIRNKNQAHRDRSDGSNVFSIYDDDDASVGSNASSRRGVLRGNSVDKRVHHHARFSKKTEPNLGEPGYVYTSMKLQMARSAAALAGHSRSHLKVHSAALAHHCFTLPLLEATLSSIIGDFLIFVRAKNRDRVLHEFFETKGMGASSASPARSRAMTDVSKEDDQHSVSSLESATFLLHQHIDVDDNMSTGSLFSTTSLSHEPFPSIVQEDQELVALAEQPATAETKSTEDQPLEVKPTFNRSPSSLLLSPVPFGSNELVDDYYFSTESAAMAPSPTIASPLSLPSSRPGSSDLNGIFPTLKAQHSQTRMSLRASSIRNNSFRQSADASATTADDSSYITGPPGTLMRTNSAQMAAMATAAALGIVHPPISTTPIDNQQLLAMVSLDAAKQQYSMVRRSHGLAPTRSLFQSSTAAVAGDDVSVSSLNSNSESGKEHRARTKSVLRTSLTTRASLFQQYLQTSKSDARLSAASPSSKEQTSWNEAGSVKRQIADDQPENSALNSFAAGMQVFQQKRLQQDDYRRLNDSFDKRVQFAVSKLHACR
jgi:hypothetical protein